MQSIHTYQWNFDTFVTQHILCNVSLAVAFNLIFRYIDDVSFINNNDFQLYVDSVYPNELEILDTTESSKSALYLNVLLNIDINGKLMTELNDNGIISLLHYKLALLM